MPFLDGLLARVMRRPVERLVAEAMNRYTHGKSDDPLYRYRVHGKLERLHIDPTAVVNDALFNVSAGEVPSRNTSSSAIRWRYSPGPTTSPSSAGNGRRPSPAPAGMW